MTDKTELQNKIIEQANTWYQLGCDHFQITPKPLTIKFEKRGRVSGTALSSRNELDFNIILASENEEEFLKQTVPHEIAHLVADQKFKKRCIHGREWKMVMNVFGLEARRCHNYNTSNAVIRKTEKFSYSCGCGNGYHTVGKKIHGKISNGSRYTCGRCKQVLVRLVSDIYPD